LLLIEGEPIMKSRFSNFNHPFGDATPTS